MSIPKEPRQLMINLMYLVLTALLALNVSAEVMNAFFTLDRGNKESIATVDNQLSATVTGLKSLLNEPSKEEFKPIIPAVDEVQATVSDFIAYIDGVRNQLIDVAGNNSGEVDDGDYKESYGMSIPKGKKNKDVTTRLLVDEGAGEEIKARVLATRATLSKVYEDLLREYGRKPFGLSEAEIEDDINSIASNIPLKVEEDAVWQEAEKESWAEYKFRQMPLAAVLPLLSQMQADAKSAEAALVNDMANLAGGRTVKFDSFFPVVQAKKAYVIKGDPFEAEISVGTYSSSLDPSDIGLYVNGQKLRVGQDGKATYSTRTSSTGKQTLNLKAVVKNPLTGEVSEGTGSYDYEVGVRSATVSADKMNVFYIGVDNPISITVAGVSSNDVNVRSSGPINVSGRGGKRTVTASRPGEATITVSGGGLPATNFDFRVKRIPDPMARLSKSSGGAMGNGEFKAQGGVGAFLDNFDFDAKCNIQGFNLTRVAKRQDPVSAPNRGARYGDKARRLVNAAKPGDIYYFDNVKARCPGDQAGRKINSMVFNIK